MEKTRHHRETERERERERDETCERRKWRRGEEGRGEGYYSVCGWRESERKGGMKEWRKRGERRGEARTAARETDRGETG